MNILIAGECSGRIRDAFIAKGHNAISCDLKASEVPGPHIQGDWGAAFDFYWDLIIWHPVCQKLAVSGNGTWAGSLARKYAAAAIEMQALEFDYSGAKYVIEQPVSALSSLWRKPNFTLQPWQVGSMESKRSCYWTHRLNPITPTVTEKPEGVKESCWKMGPSDTRAADRARTDPFIAAAMAEAWAQ